MGDAPLGSAARVQAPAAATAGATPPPATLARAHVALVAVQLCFGLHPLFGKWAFGADGFTPLGVGCWRMAFGGLCLGGLALARHGRAFWRPARELPQLAALSVLGVVANQLLYLHGLERSTAGNAGLVMCLIPVFTFLLAALARQERLEARRAAGLALAFGGAAWWYWGERPELVLEHALGNLLMAINALSYAGFLVLSRRVAPRMPALVLVAWMYLLAALVVPLLAIGQDLDPRGVAPGAWGALALILVFPTVLAYLWNVYALARLRASTASVYVYMQPMIAAGAGWGLLDEELTPALLVAAVLVFAGIRLVSWRPRAALPPARAAR